MVPSREYIPYHGAHTGIPPRCAPRDAGMFNIDRMQKGPSIAPWSTHSCIKLSEMDTPMVHILQRSDGRTGTPLCSSVPHHRVYSRVDPSSIQSYLFFHRERASNSAHSLPFCSHTFGRRKALFPPFSLINPGTEPRASSLRTMTTLMQRH